MDTQHYQPLSHALNPPVSTPARSPQGQYSTFSSNPAANGVTGTRREEEEEEEDDDEEMVEGELDGQQHHANNGGTPPMRPLASAGANGNAADKTVSAPAPLAPDEPQIIQHQFGEGVTQPKRRPGRPKGSKTRKPPAAPTATAGTSASGSAGGKQYPGFYQQPPPLHAQPTAHPEVNAHNQQYYEFQWRVLNLCAEFYNAAEELVKATSPLVIAQSYQMGPGNPVDPMHMLSEAKRICDNLLANPSQLSSRPPPPIFPVVPQYASQYPMQGAIPTPPGAAASSSGIPNAQPYMMAIGHPAGGHAAPMAHLPYPPPGAYGAAPQGYPAPAQYYGQPSSYYRYTASQAPAAPASTSTSAPASHPAPAAASTSASASATSSRVSKEGAWSDEETERLKTLAEDSRASDGSAKTGEIDWDRVVGQWGASRTRHQILIKATSMGLKETSTRPNKRRKENDDGLDTNGDAGSAPTSATTALSSSALANATGDATSPEQSQSASTPASAQPSPAPQHARPPSTSAARPAPAPAGAAKQTGGTTLTWRVPTVAPAVNTTPTNITAHRTAGEQQTSYYRAAVTAQGMTAAAATAAATKPVAAVAAQQTAPALAIHHYMYQPNGWRKESG